MTNKFNSDITKAYCGHANTLGDDHRLEIFQKQRLNRGFDETEIWSLDSTIIQFIIPRLEEFISVQTGHPITVDEAEWNKDLTQILESFKWYRDNQYDSHIKGYKKNYKRFQKNFRRFVKLFSGLWI